MGTTLDHHELVRGAKGWKIILYWIRSGTLRVVGKLSDPLPKVIHAYEKWAYQKSVEPKNYKDLNTSLRIFNTLSILFWVYHLISFITKKLKKSKKRDLIFSIILIFDGADDHALYFVNVLYVFNSLWIKKW